MARKKSTSKKKSTSTEQMRRDAIKQADRNIEQIESTEQGKGAPSKGTSKRSTRSGRSSSKKKKTKSAADTPKRMSGLDYAAKVLTESKEPLNAKAIAERAVAAGWTTEGATPHATLYSAMLREINAKGDESRFRKADRGMFTARK